MKITRLLLCAAPALTGCAPESDFEQTTFAIWQCRSTAESAAIRRTVQQIAKGKSFKLEDGDIFLGGAGKALSLTKGALTVTIFDVEGADVINVVAAHTSEPSREEREAVDQIVSMVPSDGCSAMTNVRELEMGGPPQQ